MTDSESGGSSYSSSDKEYELDKDTQEYRKVESSDSSNPDSDEESDNSSDSSIEEEVEEIEEPIVNYEPAVVEEPLQHIEANIKDTPFGLYKQSSRNLGKLVHLDRPSLIVVKNEVNGFNFKLNKNKEKLEDFLSAIEILNEHIGVKKIGKDEKIKNIIESLKNSENAEVSERLSKLLSFSYCETCRKPKEEIQLSCGHTFCSKCLKSNIYEQTKGFLLLTEEEQERLKCKLKCQNCSSPYSLEDYKNLLKEKFEQAKDFNAIREADQEKRREHFESQREIYKAMNLETKEKKGNDPNRLTQCKRCLKPKEFTHFFNDPCDCTCKECFSILILGGMRSCCFCKEVYTDKPCYMEATCDGCKSNVYIVGNQLKSICNSHSHCLECLKEACEKKKCKKCKKKLKTSQITEIKDTLNFRCFSCKDFLSRDYINPKSCCVKQTCIKCQSQSYACLACGEALESA